MKLMIDTYATFRPDFRDNLQQDTPFECSFTIPSQATFIRMAEVAQAVQAEAGNGAAGGLRATKLMSDFLIANQDELAIRYTNLSINNRDATLHDVVGLPQLTALVSQTFFGVVSGCTLKDEDEKN